MGELEGPHHTQHEQDGVELTWLDSKFSTRDHLWQQCTQHHNPYQNPPRVHFNMWLYVIGHVHNSNCHVDFPKISEKAIYPPVILIIPHNPRTTPKTKKTQPKKQNKEKQSSPFSSHQPFDKSPFHSLSPENAIYTPLVSLSFLTRIEIYKLYSIRAWAWAWAFHKIENQIYFFIFVGLT